MTKTNPNLRKAAVLLRSLDGDTAATMLAQLSPVEAATLREAIRQLGPIDTDEQADVLAEFRRIRPLAAESAADGVELRLSSTEKNHSSEMPTIRPYGVTSSKRFEFLERAPINALAPYLAREHVQTIALVLSHLRPERAAAVLAALSGKRQAEVVERLAALGETDPDSVSVVEHELAAWLEKRSHRMLGFESRNGAVASILAAADPATRSEIIANLKTHKSTLAQQLAETPSKRETTKLASALERPAARNQQWTPANRALERPAQRTPVLPATPLPAAQISFDQLIQLDDRTLAAVLRDLDPSVLVLALTGSREELIERICRQMPKRVARAFRRQLRRLGPTRLSDVETAQRAVAHVAAQRLAGRRAPAVVAAT